MTHAEIKKLVALHGRCSYNAMNKAEFKRLSMKLLRSLNKSLGVGGEVRFNAGGIAVSGDATLHADRVYVSFNADGFCGLGIMYRTCNGRTDYTGGRNHWFTFENLKIKGIEGLDRAVRSLSTEQVLTGY